MGENPGMTAAMENCDQIDQDESCAEVEGKRWEEVLVLQEIPVLVVLFTK